MNVHWIFIGLPVKPFWTVYQTGLTGSSGGAATALCHMHATCSHVLASTVGPFKVQIWALAGEAVPPPATTISCLCAAVSHILLEMFLRLPALVIPQRCARLACRPWLRAVRFLLTFRAQNPPPILGAFLDADGSGSPILRRHHPLRPRSRLCQQSPPSACSKRMWSIPFSRFNKDNYFWSYNLPACSHYASSDL